MKAFSGQDFKLHLGRYDQNPVLIGGMRVTEIHIQNQLVDSSTLVSGKARCLLSEAGEQALRISAQGLYTHSEAEQRIFNAAITRKSLIYSLFCGEGQKIQGEFLVSHYHRSGDYEAEEVYEIVLESSGPILII